MANRAAMDTIAPTHTITVAQAAEALAVSERTVWRYLKSGRLPGETVGEPGSQRTLIPREAVDALRGDARRRPDADALRAERDRLVAELAALRGRARRPAAARVSVLQRALVAPAATRHRRAGAQPRPRGRGPRRAGRAPTPLR